LPNSLRVSANARTETSLRALFEALDKIDTEVLNGTFEGSLTFGTVLARAKLNADFLNGPKHKGSTRKAVEARIGNINRHRAKTEKLQEEDQYSKGDDALYWRERYFRLAREANIWFARMREQQRTIRKLKSEM